MPNNIGAFGENFPYSNMHNMNQDWIIKVVRDFLEKYNDIQSAIDDGITELNTTAEELLTSLNDWYDTHSEDISTELEEAISDLNDWLTEHENFLDSELLDAIASFNTTAETKTAECIASIPEDYTAVAGTVNNIMQEYPNILGLFGNQITDTFTSASQTVTSTFYLTAGVVYELETSDSFTGYLNFYSAGDNTTIARIYSATRVKFTPAVSGVAKIFNGNSNKTGSFTINVTPYVVAGTLKSHPVMINSNATLSTVTGGTNDVADFPLNEIVTVGSSSVTNLTNYPTTLTSSGIGTYITFDGQGGSVSNGQAQLYIGTNGTATRWKVDNSFTNWKTNELNHKQYNTTEAFTTDYPNAKLSSIPLNKVVCIGASDMEVIDKPIADFVGNVITFSARTGLNPGACQLAIDIYKNNLYIRCYRYNENGNFWTPWYSVADNSAIFHVGTGQTYTSLTSLLLDLNRASYKKTIYIHEGEYDIFQEYLDEVDDGRIEIPADDIQAGDYFEPYNAFVPNNTNIIGLGNVILKMTPTANSVTLGESRTWSPLNIYGNVSIENITIKGKNCRYCLHNDDHNTYPNAKQYYKNCQFIYDYSDTDANQNRLGYNITIGFGIQENGEHVFEDCLIAINTSGNNSAYYGHDRNDGSNGKLLLKNCIIYSSNFSNNRTVRLQSISTTQGKVQAKFENCYINGGITYDIYTVNAQQNFEVTLLNTNKVPVNRVIPSGGTITDIYNTTWYNPLQTPSNAQKLIYVDSL